MGTRNRQLSFDVRALRSMIADAHDDEPGPMLPWSLLASLGRLIPAEDFSICNLDLLRQERVLQQAYVDGEPCLERGEPAPGDYRPFWAHYRSFWDGEPPSRAGHVRRWTDRYPGRLLDDQPLYREAFKPAGVKYLMSIGLPAAAGHERNVLFWRFSGADFSDLERDLLRLLRPHISEVYALATRRRRGVLTPREWEVLALVAAGDDNAQIAARLFTSVGTVRKHLEHIYDKAGVRTRGAAVAQLMPERIGPGTPAGPDRP